MMVIIEILKPDYIKFPVRPIDDPSVNPFCINMPTGVRRNDEE